MGHNTHKNQVLLLLLFFFYKQAIYYDEGIVCCCKYRWTNKTKPEPLHWSMDEFI